MPKTIYLYSSDIDCYVLLMLWIGMGNRWLVICFMFHYQKASCSHVRIRQKKSGIIDIKNLQSPLNAP